MTLPSTIAIDGPAGSGKSTISYLLAQKHNYLFVDTGIFYRAITLVALRSGIALDDHPALSELARDTKIEIIPAPNDPHHQAHVLADTENITDYIRTSEVEAAVSTVSAIGGVREALVEKQREVAQQGNIIMAGRDIGTVVLPNADVKLYIDATLEERAHRRFAQKQEKGQEVDLQEITDALARRDKIDTERAISPLKPADDAIYLLTDGLTIDDTLAKIGEVIATWQPSSA